MSKFLVHFTEGMLGVGVGYGVFVGYSWGVHGVFVGYTYVSGMCRVCIGNI